MAVQKSVVVGSVMGMLFSFQASAIDALAKKSCPTSVEANYALTTPEMQDKLRGMLEVKAVTRLPHNYVESFIFEYEKFPLSLRQEMAKAGAKMNLLVGNGVAEDPSWPGQIQTSDGRYWAKVPGSGGSAYSSSNPTRIVINNIYERSQEYGHGSTNLILHEHAHTLDHLYHSQTVSGTTPWKRMLSNPENRETIKRIFSSYEANSELESFAELFAYYHNCAETRAHLYEILPEAANILANLTNVKKKGEKLTRTNRYEPYHTEAPEEKEQAPRRSRRFSLRKFFEDIGEGVEDLINPDNN